MPPRRFAQGLASRLCDPLPRDYPKSPTLDGAVLRTIGHSEVNLEFQLLECADVAGGPVSDLQ